MLMYSYGNTLDGQKPYIALQRGTGALDRRTAAQTVSCVRDRDKIARAPTHASKKQECMCQQQNNVWPFMGTINHWIWRSWRRVVAGNVDLQLGTIGAAVSN